jgi:hypothetical protein
MLVKLEAEAAVILGIDTLSPFALPTKSNTEFPEQSTELNKST